MRQIPNPKTQIPRKLSNHKDGNEESNAACSIFGIWKLGFVWDLELGIWDLPKGSWDLPRGNLGNDSNRLTTGRAAPETGSGLPHRGRYRGRQFALLLRKA